MNWAKNLENEVSTGAENVTGRGRETAEQYCELSLCQLTKSGVLWILPLDSPGSGAEKWEAKTSWIWDWQGEEIHFSDETNLYNKYMMTFHWYWCFLVCILITGKQNRSFSKCQSASTESMLIPRVKLQVLTTRKLNRSLFVTSSRDEVTEAQTS